jgi:Domain of unknown function (DUF4783)
MISYNHKKIMKNLLGILLFVPLLAFAAQPVVGGPANMEAISRALSAGDADALGKYFADELEVSIMGKAQNCSKSKATELVRGFFSSNRPEGFNAVHQGNSRGGSDQYCIGNLNAAGGNFRVYLYFKTINGTAVIQEIRFEKE